MMLRAGKWYGAYSVLRTAYREPLREDAVAIQHYRELVVWQKAIELTARCYAMTRRFPADERFGLTSQIRRAAVSIPSNIAEGHGRLTRGEFLNQLSVARGSLCELETLFVVAGRQNFASSATLRVLSAEADEVGRMLYTMMKKLGARLTSR
jgi:four helix bundle protein